VPRAPWLLLLLAAALRALVCVRTDVPGRDGVSYLWMAENAANGSFGALFATVFHPLYPALVAVPCALGIEVEFAGKLVAAGLGALAVVPLWFVARAIAGERTALWCGIGFASSAWFNRHPAECMSEGPFHLAAALWAACSTGARPRPALAGVAAAAAYLLRPEGLALVLLGPLWSWLRGERRAAGMQLATAVPVAALLPLGFAHYAGQATLTPKAAFNYEVGIGATPSPIAHYAGEALQLPFAALEEIGWLWFPLALLGIWRARPFALRSPHTLLLMPFLLQCLVVPMLQAHWRFLSGFGALLFVFAGLALPPLLDALRVRGRWLPTAALLLLFASEARVVQARNVDRLQERALGAWLRQQLRAGERIASDMPRLDWFAGQQPPPPRVIRPADLLAQASDPQCRFVALVERRDADGTIRRRTEFADGELLGLGFTRVAGAPGMPPLTDVALFGRR
jgi:hypothetical protein